MVIFHGLTMVNNRMIWDLSSGNDIQQAIEHDHRNS